MRAQVRGQRAAQATIFPIKYQNDVHGKGPKQLLFPPWKSFSSNVFSWKDFSHEFCEFFVKSSWGFRVFVCLCFFSAAELEMVRNSCFSAKNLGFFSWNHFLYKLSRFFRVFDFLLTKYFCLFLFVYVFSVLPTIFLKMMKSKQFGFVSKICRISAIFSTSTLKFWNFVSWTLNFLQKFEWFNWKFWKM